MHLVQHSDHVMRSQHLSIYKTCPHLDSFENIIQSAASIYLAKQSSPPPAPSIPLPCSWIRYILREKPCHSFYLESARQLRLLPQGCVDFRSSLRIARGVGSRKNERGRRGERGMRGRECNRCTMPQEKPASSSSAKKFPI